MSRESQMNNVGVFEMAERREKRAAEQRDMLARCGLPLVCINMNIAGPVKRGALIDWAFFRALNAAANSFKGKIRGFAFTNEKTGIEAMLAVDAAAENPALRFFGRLFCAQSPVSHALPACTFRRKLAGRAYAQHDGKRIPGRDGAFF